MRPKIVQIAHDLWRVTFALPLGIDHVHCYAVRADSGGLMLVDTGLGGDGAREAWRDVLGQLDGPVERIVVTHFHPDHVGASADVAELTGAPVGQGAVDYRQCVEAWGRPDSAGRMLAYLRAHGMPPSEVEALRGAVGELRRRVRFARDPRILEPGERIDGWEILHLPGHADGHIALLRDGVLLAGDALLATISPNVGLYPDSAPDPLGDYLASLERIVSLAPALALAGHGDPIEDPAGRARELIGHHEHRLELTLRALAPRPLNAYEASLALFPEPLSPGLRRFALAEARAHLERLAVEGEVERLGASDAQRYAVAAG